MKVFTSTAKLACGVFAKHPCQHHGDREVSVGPVIQWIPGASPLPREHSSSTATAGETEIKVVP